MKKRFFITLSILLSLATIATACGSRVEPTPTTDPNAIMTEVAQTVAAEITAEALLTPSPTATLAPTPTIPATPTQDLTALPTVPTVAVTVPASGAGVATQPVTTGDNAAWVEDVTVPDGEVYYAKESFKKIWRVKNTGSTTWTTDYMLVNIDDNSWGADVKIPLTVSVAPGEEVNLSVTLRAPNSLGEHFSRWFLMNPSSQVFGEELYVYITVGTEEEKTPTPAG